MKILYESFEWFVEVNNKYFIGFDTVYFYTIMILFMIKMKVTFFVGGPDLLTKKNFSQFFIEVSAGSGYLKDYKKN